MAGFLSRLFGGDKTPAPFCSAVVAAAGASLRMGGENKLLLRLDGIPVLIRSLLALDRSPEINEIIVVTRGEDILEVGSLCREYGVSKPVRIVAGSDARLKSVLCGVLEVSPRADLIAVHDGARPLVTPEVVGAAVRKAAECGAAAPAIPLKDTVKSAAAGQVTATPDRSALFAVQTPQVFEAGLLKAALQSSVTAGADLTDDCSAVERLGMSVMLTEGSEENIKITTPLDLALAEAILSWRGEGE